MCRVANCHDALVVPLPENILLKRYEHRAYPLLKNFLELQSRRNVVILPLLEGPLFVFLSICRYIISVGSLWQLEEVEPVYATSGAAIQDIRLVLPKNRVGRSSLNAFAWVRDAENAAVIARHALKLTLVVS